jgi:hypothetical protein
MWKTLLEEKTVIVEFGESRRRYSYFCAKFILLVFNSVNFLIPIAYNLPAVFLMGAGNLALLVQFQVKIVITLDHIENILLCFPDVECDITHCQMTFSIKTYIPSKKQNPYNFSLCYI